MEVESEIPEFTLSFMSRKYSVPEFQSGFPWCTVLITCDVSALFMLPQPR